MATTLTISYTTVAGNTKHVTVAARAMATTLRRITGAGGTINYVTA